MTIDLAPFAGTVGDGFFIGLITGYAIKKVIKLAAIIVGLFIAALAYLEYQRILNVYWHKVQAISQNGIDWAEGNNPSAMLGGYDIANPLNSKITIIINSELIMCIKKYRYRYFQANLALLVFTPYRIQKNIRRF